MSFSKAEFAANLRAERARRGISQRELADMVGMSPDAIVKYESAKGYVPGADKVYALCAALNISPNDLLGWKQSA